MRISDWSSDVCSSDLPIFTDPLVVPNGLWFFDGMPHRVIVMDRLRTPPVTGHLTGETRKGGDAMNALFDQMPEDTVMCLTLDSSPQDVLEAHLNHLARKAVGQRSEEHTSELQSLMRIPYAVFCSKNKKESKN